MVYNYDNNRLISLEHIREVILVPPCDLFFHYSDGGMVKLTTKNEFQAQSNLRVIQKMLNTKN